MKNSLSYRIITQIICVIAAAIFLFPMVLMINRSLTGAGLIANYRQALETFDILPNFITSIIVVFGTLVLVAGKPERLALCESANVFRLAWPFGRAELVSAVRMLFRS